MASSDIYDPVHDQIFTQTAKKIARDADTSYRSSNSLPAKEGGVASLSAPLNGTSAQRTIFEGTAGSGSRLRFDGLALRVQMVLGHSIASTCAHGGSAPYVNFSSPAWNMVFALFRNISLQFNAGDQPVYQTMSENVLEECTARLIRTRTWQEISEMDYCLFTPVGATRYSVQSSTQTPAATTVATAYPDPSGRPYERALNYTGEGTGDVTHQRVITKIIPISGVLCPELPPAAFRNLKSWQLTIDWATTTALLDRLDTDAQSLDNVYVVGCDMLTDAYVMSPSQSIEASVEKTQEAQSDYLPYLNTRCYKMAYTPGTAMQLSGITNLDSIMIFQIARGVHNANSTRFFASYGEFLPMTGVTSGTTGNLDADGTLKARADDPLGKPATTATSPGIEKIQISIGEISYPTSQLITCRSNSASSTKCCDFSTLYYQYLLAVNRFGRRDASACIPYQMFKTTMPFVLLKPWANNASKISGTKDIIIQMDGGLPSTVAVVVFTNSAMVITPDAKAVKF